MKNYFKIKILSRPLIALSIFSFLVVFCFGFVVALPAANALDLGAELNKAGTAAYGAGKPADISTVIGTIIKAVLGFLGTVALILVIYGGFLWMTAGGNEEKVTKARKLLLNAVVGLIIIVSAYSITTFVIGAISGAAGTGSGGGGTDEG